MDDRPQNEGEDEDDSESESPNEEKAKSDRSPAPPKAEPAPMVRTALIVGPIVACVGILWTAIAPSNASSAAILVGLLTAIVATHLFGRRGAAVDVNDVL
jgi:hypothetical protein